MKAIVQDKSAHQTCSNSGRSTSRTSATGTSWVRVRVASVNPVNPADRYAMTGNPYVARPQMEVRKPKTARLGLDLAGVVEAVGGNIARFKPGDEVFDGGTGTSAGCVCLPETDRWC
jgi:NADPH:quinone reductase-like Zn-dependent oxidoreductase